MTYAVGKFAVAHCDRCGFKYKLLELRKEWTGLKVCDSCFEPKHPQLGPFNHIADPEAIYDPRVDTDQEANGGNVFSTDNPIGRSFRGFLLTSALGRVTITT
jgi:hypothetical protein